MAPLYQFRPGRSLKNVDPQTLGTWLEALRKEHDELTPEIVLTAAKDPASPGHHAFEWDDSAAANAHRLNQARRLVVSIRVMNSTAGKPTVAYVSVRTPEKGRSYVPTTEALDDEQLRARVLDEIRRFIESIERRYAHFEEVAALLDALKTSVA